MLIKALSTVIPYMGNAHTVKQTTVCTQNPYKERVMLYAFTGVSGVAKILQTPVLKKKVNLLGTV